MTTDNQLTDPERLAALETSGLLTRSVHERLDHLAFAACRLLLADAVQINALDEEMQYTVVGYPPGAWPALPVEDSGCREIIMSGRFFAVENTREHPITCQMPWSEKFGGYLGVPVLYDGHILGSVCALNRAPRAWKSYEITALDGVARLVEMSLDRDER